MSSSPSPYHDSRPTSPQNAAEVRSAAIAKLKRAASLPRRTDGRRPSQTTAETGTINGSTSTPVRRSGQDHDEEVLSSSPTNMGFEGSSYQTYPGGGTSLQRSNSASSSFHMPTPPHLSGYNQIGIPNIIPGSSGQPSPHSDWSGIQQSQLHIPSLSPMPTGHPVSGRNTPSPLPSLGELRTLQRSNSAAARARAMDKLTGGRETPAFEDQALDLTPTRPGLQRADSLGAPRLGNPPVKATPTRTDHPPVAFVDPRSRLQRSFTVGGSNMGEERRSAVGRRMVARLGERRAAREEGENDVERIWEERRAVADQDKDEDEDGDLEEEQAENEDGEYDQSLSIRQEGNHHHLEAGIPGLIRHSPTEPPHPNPDLLLPNGTLGIPEDDRPGSRTTQISDSDAFEYDLRRSLSSRTARGAVGTVTENRQAPRSRQAHHIERLDQEDEEEDERDIAEGRVPTLNDLGLPNPPFATPSRHMTRGSASTDSTHSPGGDSMLSADGLQSMMFVMGRGSGVDNGMKRDTTGFPVDVDEGGASHWGTPAKDLQQHPSASTSSDSPTPASYSHPPSSAIDQTLSPLELSARSSIMSWESLGGERDREIPSDPNYPESSPNGHPRKNGSISRTVGKVKEAMRKRSQSRSSTGSATSPPTSPKSLGEALAVAVQTFGGRRGSASSVSPSQSSVARSFARGSPMTPQGDYMRHQDSISSLSPSFLDESSANGMLLQHQLANDPQPILEMPRAKKDDPRVFNSKLSPFPGIESRKMSDSLSIPEHPRLIHQNSDSVVPSQQRVTREVQDTIYALPLQPPPAGRSDRRGSEDSIGRKGWLAKAFGAANSPRSSGGTMSRKSSITDHSHHSINRSSPEKQQLFSESDNDPFAGPPPQIGRSRAVSPSVSTVAEVNEDVNRMTQFTVHRSATHTPIHEDIEEEEGSRDIFEEGGDRGRSLHPRSMEVLARMDEILALEQEDPARPDILDDPPRKLLLATQVLQVVNMHTVKDRYLLLFNDILAICKPVIENGPSANLDMRFVVKSIVALDKLKASGFTDDSSLQNSSQQDSLTTDFITRFAQDPISACTSLIERNHWKDDLLSLANTIFHTPQLDKTHLGHVLSSEPDLLNAYIDTFNFLHIPIQDAFRIFLLSLRLPSHPDSIERIINAFASRYFSINKQNLSYDLERTHSLISGMMMLNDSLHDDTFGFAMYNPGLTVTVWIAAYGERDPHRIVSDELLRSVYTSIQKDPLQPPLAKEYGNQTKNVTFGPGRIPGRLTYNVWSEPITVTLPAIDHDFRIRLMGEGLQTEPAILDFSRNREATFRIRGTTLGSKTLLFARLGRNAPLYASLDNGKTIHVERAFMKHTFNLTFGNHLGRDRKYCFSVPDAELRTKWGVLLPRQTALMRQKKSIPTSSMQQKVRVAAERAGLLVLRDALIPPLSINPRHGEDRGRTDRSGSVSVVYPKNSQVGREKGDQAKVEGTRIEGPHGFMEETTGKEVVLVCRQNSLLPVVLELLQAGVEPKDRGARF